MQQRTLEWYQARLGKPTASRFGDIKYGRKPGEWSQVTISYMMELLAERLTGEPKIISSAAIEWGIEHEDEARELYTKKTGMRVFPAPFYDHVWSGGSPDGVIDASGDSDLGGQPIGIIEIKCPYNSANHIAYMLNGPDEHTPQLQANMYFVNAVYCDFISYDPRMPEALQLYIKRVMYDADYVADMMKTATRFADDLDKLEITLRQ